MRLHLRIGARMAAGPTVPHRAAKLSDGFPPVLDEIAVLPLHDNDPMAIRRSQRIPRLEFSTQSGQFRSGRRRLIDQAVDQQSQSTHDDNNDDNCYDCPPSLRAGGRRFDGGQYLRLWLVILFCKFS